MKSKAKPTRAPQQRTDQSKAPVINASGPVIQEAGKISIINRKVFIWLVLIVVGIMAVYLPIRSNDFVRWDDDWYIQNNTQFNNVPTHGTSSLFTEFFKGQYSPVTTLVIYLLHDGDKTRAAGYHTLSLVLHVINTLLVFLLVFLLFKNTSFALIVAALFGFHTLQAEAVAWASAIKVILYTTFFLASVILYIRYVFSGRIIYYFVSFLMFLLSFLSKEQAVTLSVSLIAVDFFLGRKLTGKKVILEKVPFLALSLVMGIVTIYASRTGEFFDPGMSLPFYKQISYASYALVHYCLGLIAPVHLSAFYPYPENRALVPFQYWLALILALGILVLWIRSFTRNKTIAFALAFFFINILLVLQIMPLRDFIAADRFVYIPGIGFFIIIAWLCHRYFYNNPRLKKTAQLVFLAYVAILGLLSYSRTAVWKDSLTLFADMVQKEPESSVAWNNRGLAHYDRNQYQQAIKDFNTSIGLNPNSVFAYNNLGIACTKSGDLKKALQVLGTAIQLRPEFMQAYYNRADALTLSNDFQGAIADYDKVLQLRPGYTDVYSLRGIAKAKSGNMNLALPDLDKAVSLRPDNPEAYMNRGVVKLNLADYQGAIADFSRTISLKPGFAYSYYNRGLAYIKSGNSDPGCRDLDQARKMGFPQAEGAIRQYCQNLQ